MTKRRTNLATSPALWSQNKSGVGKMAGSYQPRKRVERRKNPGGGNTLTIPMSQQAIDLKLEMGQANSLDPSPKTRSADEIAGCPFIKALEPREREIWLMFTNGVIAKQIAEIFLLRKDEVSRILHAIKSKIRHLHRFWTLVRTDPKIMDRFERKSFR